MNASAKLLPIALLALIFVITLSTSACGVAQTSSNAYRSDIDEWHAGRVDRLTQENGWLSLVGLHPLAEGENHLGTSEANQVVLAGEATSRLGVIHVEGVEAQLEMLPMEGSGSVRIPLRRDTEGEPTVMRVGTLSFYVIERAGALYLRVKDSQAQTRLEFEGIERYDVDERFRIDAHFEAYDPPRTIAVPDVLGNSFDEACPGAVVFDWEGREYRVEPTGVAGESLFLVFGDETNGEGSYGGGRFLSIEPADADGNTVIDFNRATNPPCAFTPYATCPLPPRQNVLPFAVTAGEKNYGEEH